MSEYIYQKLAAQLRAQILAGQFQIGQRLPSIRTLSAEHGVAKITVQHALHKLEASGVVVAKAKSGYYVSEQANAHEPKANINQPSEPKSIDVPDVFYQIMARSAAFDIAPHQQSHEQLSSHQSLLNRYLSRSQRQGGYKHYQYYGDPAGDSFLREQICQQYRRRNTPVSPDQVCITAGCQNALFIALMASCKPGDTVAIESPGFYGVLQLLQQLNLKAIEIPVSYTQGLDPEKLKQAASQWNIKACVVTPCYATPTGAAMSYEQKQSLVNVAQAHNITLIEDDIYGELGFYKQPEPLISFKSTAPIILCSSVSKSLSRDLRLGWLICNDNAQSLIQLKLINQLATSQSLQKGLAEFIAEGHYQRHLIQYRRKLLAQRDELRVALAKYWKLDTRFTLPDGGLCLWVQLGTKTNTFSLYAEALEKDIVLTPGRLFSNSQDYDNYLRLSFAHPLTPARENALQQLGQLFNVMKNT